MARKQLIRHRQFPYHITIRSNNRDWFKLSMDEMWRICISSIDKAFSKVNVKIEAFVLMSNHYHLLIRTPDANIDQFMFHLNSYISKQIRLKTNRINRVFGDRYKWSLIQKNSYYFNVVRYIFQNPLRANIVKCCEDYPYSSLYYHLRDKKLPFSPPEEFLRSDFLEAMNVYMNDTQIKNYRSALNKVGAISTDA